MTSNRDSAIPPSYTASGRDPQVEGSPPAYTFPEVFRIGSKQTTGPLVTTAQLHGHLGLLQQFWDLRQVVENGKDARIPASAQSLEPELRWAWFVALAVDRFERWVKTMRHNSAVPDKDLRRFDPNYLAFALGRLDSMPPVDVAMVWHAYLLNPGWYSEDTTRIPELSSLMTQNDTFTKAIETNVFNGPPSEARIQAWVKTTSSPFDPFDSAAITMNRTFQCPECRGAVNAPFITADGKGYSQKNFSIDCPSPTCGLHDINKSKLGAFKFVRDMSAPRTLAGTIFTPTNSADTARGELVKGSILRGKAFKTDITDQKTGKTRTMYTREYEDLVYRVCKGSPTELRAFAGAAMKGGGGRLLPRIMGAYTDDSIFSIDLGGAVLRQGSFVKKMQALRWTDPGFFDAPEDEVVLQHSVARYHAFLDLIASSPGAFFVPTLDIDLAWHTHQLFAERYMKDTKEYVGRYVDHDDKVEEEHLSTSFDLTCRAWQSRFHVAYMHCGCPLPGDTLGQKLAAKLKRNSQQQPSFLLPPDNPDILNATHPSDHNSVFAFHHAGKADAARKKRAAKAEKRRTRDAANVQKGKLAQESYARGEGHGQAFLVPVPYYYGAGFGGCMAWYGGVNGGAGGGACAGGSCAAGAGSCATGGSACGSGGGCGSAGCGGGGGGGGCGGGGGGGGCGGGGCGGG